MLKRVKTAVINGLLNTSRAFAAIGKSRVAYFCLVFVIPCILIGAVCRAYTDHYGLSPVWALCVAPPLSSLYVWFWILMK
jgi:hypothetical protein